MNKMLIICGPSGGGKSVLERTLCSNYNFRKLMQVTTRKPRQDESYGNPYIFVTDEDFEKNKSQLIGRLGVSENTIFKDKYGTIPTTEKTKYILTAILAEEAIFDFLTSTFQRENKFETLIIGVNGSDTLLQSNARDGRGAEFIKKEREVLNLADIVIKNDANSFIDAQKVVNIINLIRPGFLNN